MRHKFAHKQPRFHPDLEWERNNLTNEFIDINRLAMDDRYPKQSAPLSKRRNGIGFTDGKTPGLFGFGSTIEEAASDPKGAYLLGGLVAVGAYTIIDYFTHKANQSQLRRMIKRTPSSLIVGAVAFALFAPSSTKVEQDTTIFN